MIALTINNNFLRLASPTSRLFKKIPLNPSVVTDYTIINQKGFVALVEKALVGIELPSNEVIVGLNEGEGFVDNYSKALEALGFKVRGFVLLALSLANLTKEKETPHLIVCLEDDELIFVLVKEGGEVVFSATYPVKHILESTTAVLEFAKEKYQTTNIKKIYICGENTKLVSETLKKAGLVVEIIDSKPSDFIKPVSLLQFKDSDLIIHPEAEERKRLPSFSPSLPRVKVPNLRKFLIGLVLINGLAIGTFLVINVVLPRFRPKTLEPVAKPEKVAKVTPVPEATKSAESTEATGSAEPIIVKDSEATESASPSAKLDKSVYNIQVLNAKGTQGVAAKGQAKLEELGYIVTDIDNTTWSLYSIIKTKEGNGALLEALTSDLESDYEFGDPEVLEADSEFDAVVILGSR